MVVHLIYIKSSLEKFKQKQKLCLKYKKTAQKIRQKKVKTVNQ